MLKPNSRRGQIARNLQIGMLLFCILSIFLDYYEYAYLDYSINRTDSILLDVSIPEMVRSIFYILYSCVGIFSLVYFLMWFRRAYYNIEVLQSATQYANSCAVWCWFVPILNLYRPYRMMKEIYTGARNYFIQNNLSRDTISLSWIGWWWGFSLINVFLIRFSMRMSRALSLEDQLFASQVSLISSLVSIVTVVLVIIVITDYMKAEEQIAELYYTNEPEDEQPDIEDLDPSSI